MIYLDNAATTRKKPKSVLKAVKNAITKYSANPGRSGHRLSIHTGEQILLTRQKICAFFNAYSEENCIFTSNCSEALNLAILGTAKTGGHIITTGLEHNSVLRPLSYLKSKGLISFSTVIPNVNGKITLENIKKEILPNTYLIITTHISNVTGAQTDINKIGTFAKSKDILYLVDAAQSAGHKPINMQKDNIDMLAIPSHKGLLGVCGAGALLVSPKIKLSPIKFGGTGTNSISLIQPTSLPEAFETGTLPTPAILSMKAGISFLEKRQNKITKRIENLTKIIINNFKQNKKIAVYSHFNNGVVCFNIKDISSTDIAEILNDKYNICVRAGLHCAPLAHAYLGTTKQGAVRASLSYATTKREVATFIKAVNLITKLV